MPGTRSTPSTEERSAGIAAFVDQQHYDPLIPSSPAQEGLTQVRPTFNPIALPTDHQATHRGRPVGDDMNGLHWQDLSSSTTSHRHQLDDTPSQPERQPPALSSYQDASSVSPHTHETPGSHHSTSPTNDHSSDFEYPRLHDYGAQDFENTFLLEADFGPLTIPDDDLDLPQDTDTSRSEEPASATSTTSHAVSYGSRRSTGIATLSSHLMSPSLTETTSPGSASEAISPTMKTRLLGGGPMSRLSSQNTTTETTYVYDSTAHAQNTPALTGSSVEASPEPMSRADFAQTKSPVVRIESYSRGDSPARVVASMKRSGSKRGRASRSSSHLAAPCEDSSEEGDQDNLVDRSRSLHKSNALDVLNTYDLRATRVGVDPSAREELAKNTILNFKDQDEEAELAAKNAEVSKWLAISEAGSEMGESTAPPVGARIYASTVSRRRAKSTSDQRELEEDARGIETARQLAQSARIPGPNVLLDEESSEDEEEDENTGSYIESAPASIDGNAEACEDLITSFGNAGGIHPQDAHPWVDPLYLRSLHDSSPSQPPTANAAMMRFIKRAADIETASRAATWGTTTRRLSEADLERMIGQGGLLSRLSVSRTKIKDQSDRRGSFLEQVEHAASKFIPKRSSSHLRRKTSEPIKHLSSEAVEHEYSRKDSTHARKESLHGRKESLGSRTGSPSISTSLRRIPSVGRRPKSPKINTGSAVAAVATQIATLGGNGSISPTAASSPTGPWSSARNALKRTARGEFHRPAGGDLTQPGIADLWNKQGGPPLPSFTSYPEEEEVAVVSRSANVPHENAESDEIVDDKGVAMDFTPRNDHIIPTYDGFKLNVRDINPRLPPYLVERIGQEQLRRFKKLVEFKVKHAQANQHGSCSSGSHCPNIGGVPTYFPSKSSQREPRLSHTGFSTVLEGSLDEDEEAVADGAVTAAQFPPGVPMPPVKRLPAQFECPLCFTVKRFQKPSDWSKHVHEDLQPFTCTFPTCPDPKSFKRKADWVRHENERHRQLEWWRCTEDGCSHQCYRRDNFVQHLVREHKMPEPKAKNAKPNKPAVRGPAKAKSRACKEINHDELNDDRVLVMIETCRHETPKSPSNEPCRFCGNICISWKKLTVHLARHMEQISMPVLKLVKQKDVTADTIISPIEPRLPTQVSMSPVDPTQSYRGDGISMSPHGNHREVNVVKHELPGSFTPLQSSVVFQAPGYEDQATGTFPWGQPSNSGSHIHSHLSHAGYGHGVSGTYPSGHLPYQEPEPDQFVTPNGQPGYVPTSSISDTEAIYGSMARQTGQAPRRAYAATQSFPMTMDQQPLYTNQYMLQNGQAALGPRQVSTNGSIPMEYAITGDLPFTQASTDPSNYPTHLQQQFYSYPM
ncbi:hypothetical protein MMC13_007955 [Lambiella insularis]|nr:hypothetical protein [Lambiella insularis]